MKILSTLFFLIVCTISFSQSSLLDVAKAQKKHYKSGNLELYTVYMDSVYLLSPYYHNLYLSGVIKSALETDSKALEAIEVYSSNLNLNSSHIVRPLNDFLNLRSTSKLDGTEDSVFTQLSTSQDTSYFSSLYMTASYYELNRKLSLADSTRIKWFKQLLRHNEQVSSAGFNEVNDLCTYIEFVLKKELYDLNELPSKSIFNFYIPPGLQDKLWMHALVKKEYGFYPVEELQRSIISDKLRLGDKNQELFGEFVQFVCSSPSKENLDWLKAEYNLTIPFEDFWYTHSQKNWKSFYDVPRVNEYIDSLRNKDQWIVLDVWGTWCVPCRKELPKFNKMSVAFNKLTKTPIQFLSLSYDSRNLEEFMKRKGYHFPVLEVSNEEINQMAVDAFPTTYLIAPNNKFVVLPVGADKEEMIKILSLLDW